VYGWKRDEAAACLLLLIALQCTFNPDIQFGAEEMATTQLSKSGNSLAVRIPKSVAEDARLREGDPVTMTLAPGGGLLIKTTRHRYKLRQLVARITAKNRHDETDWGKPEGKEVW
jgi:antitoxin MazE